MGGLTFLSNWLKDIVVIFILITITELIMPKGNMKKYINLVIGLLIIFTIISPIAKLFNLDFDFDQAVMSYSKTDEITNNELEEFYRQQELQIEKIYRDKLSDELGKLIINNTDYEVVSIDVSINKDKENNNYGEINNLVIVVQDKSEEVDKSKISIDKVEKIEMQKNTKEFEDNLDKYEDILDLIENKFLIEKENITIITNIKGER